MLASSVSVTDDHLQFYIIFCKKKCSKEIQEYFSKFIFTNYHCTSQDRSLDSLENAQMQMYSIIGIKFLNS